MWSGMSVIFPFLLTPFPQHRKHFQHQLSPADRNWKRFKRQEAFFQPIHWTFPLGLRSSCLTSNILFLWSQTLTCSCPSPFLFSKSGSPAPHPQIPDPPLAQTLPSHSGALLSPFWPVSKYLRSLLDSFAFLDFFRPWKSACSLEFIWTIPLFWNLHFVLLKIKVISYLSVFS